MLFEQFCPIIFEYFDSKIVGKCHFHVDYKVKMQVVVVACCGWSLMGEVERTKRCLQGPHGDIQTPSLLSLSHSFTFL